MTGSQYLATYVWNGHLLTKRNVSIVSCCLYVSIIQHYLPVIYNFSGCKTDSIINWGSRLFRERLSLGRIQSAKKLSFYKWMALPLKVLRESNRTISQINEIIFIPSESCFGVYCNHNWRIWHPVLSNVPRIIGTKEHWNSTTKVKVRIFHGLSGY